MLSTTCIATGCKKKNNNDDDSWSMSNLKYFSLDITDFESLKIEDGSSDTVAQSNLISNAITSKDNKHGNMQIKIKHKNKDGYEPAEFIVENDNNGNLVDHNGNKLNIGDRFKQTHFPIILDKLIVMADLILISFVDNLDLYQRPDNEPLVWNAGGMDTFGPEGRLYDRTNYESTRHRATFIVDNYTGKLYYLQPGHKLDINSIGYLKELVSFGTDYIARVRPKKQEISDSTIVLRDKYGQVLVPSNEYYHDAENKVLYYHEPLTECFRTTSGEIICIKYNYTDFYSSSIKAVYRIGENFTFIPVTEDYEAESIDILSHKMKVGGTFFNKIKDGYVYASSGWGNIRMKRLGFLENKTDINLYFEDAYLDYPSYSNDSSFEGEYGISLWDYNTVLVYIHNADTMTTDWYYANVLEDNEFDGTTDTFDRLHPIISGCEILPNPTNMGLGYLQERARESSFVEKDGITYKFVENKETNSISAIQIS